MLTFPSFSDQPAVGSDIVPNNLEKKNFTCATLSTLKGHISWTFLAIARVFGDAPMNDRLNLKINHQDQSKSFLSHFFDFYVIQDFQTTQNRLRNQAEQFGEIVPKYSTGERTRMYYRYLENVCTF